MDGAVQMSYNICITHKNVLELTQLDLLEKEKLSTHTEYCKLPKICNVSTFKVLAS